MNTGTAAADFLMPGKCSLVKSQYLLVDLVEGSYDGLDFCHILP